MSEAKIDIACICGTWLDDTILDSMIVTDEFCIFREYRINREGGGVCVICRNNAAVCDSRVDLPVRFNRMEYMILTCVNY